MNADLVTSIAAFVVTIMILSYLIGDNPAFRIAVHVFVGVAAGYIASVAWWQVLLPRLLLPMLTGTAMTRAGLAVPLLLGGLLLMKAWPPLSRLGAPALGAVAGVASAVAIGGAVRGTLLPQLYATITSFDSSHARSLESLLGSGLVLVSLIASMVYFQFSAGVRKDGTVRRSPAIEFVAAIGGVFIAITLGVLFAGVFSAALTALIERIVFLWSVTGMG